MPTLLVVGLALLGSLVSLVLGTVAIATRRARPGLRRALGLGAIAFLVGSLLFGLWGLGILFRATAPVPATVVLYGWSPQSVYALTARDATTLWSVSVSPAQISGSPVERDGVVYVSTNNGVDAYTARDGHQLWHSATTIQVPSDGFAQGALYGSSIQNGLSTHVAALDLTNGHTLWEIAAPSSQAFPNFASNVVPVSGVVLEGDGQGTVHAIDSATGAQVWQVALNAGPVVRLTVDSSGIVYGSLDEVGASPNLVSAAQAFALDPQTQKVRWQQAIKESGTVLPVLSVAQGTVYLGTVGALVAFDASSGSERWHYPLTFGTGSSQVVGDQGVAYFGAVGGVYALHASDGALVWHYADSSSLAFGTPVISDGVVFTQTAFAGPENLTLDSGRHVFAFRASDGHQYYQH